MTKRGFSRQYVVCARLLAGIIAFAGLAAVLVSPIWADRDEVILSFEAIVENGASGGATLRLSSESVGELMLISGQHTTVPEGEEISLEIVPGATETFKAWEGAFTGLESRVTYAFFADATIRAVLATPLGDSASPKIGNESDAPEKNAPGEGVRRAGTNNLTLQDDAPATATEGEKDLTEIWVDFAFFGVELGTMANPYNSLPEGVTEGTKLAAISPPGVIKIKPGSSAESIRIDPAAPLRLEAPNGRARIGVLTSYLLSAAVTGSGTVLGAGAYAPDSTASLTATPAGGGWAFSHWLGDLTGFANPASLLVDGNKSVTAVFLQNPSNLTASSVTLDDDSPLPNQAIAGDTLMIKWTVTNSSGNAASSGDGSWVDNVVLSRDAILSADDKSLNPGGQTHSGSLAGGGSYVVTVAITIPDVSPGAYYLIAAADVGNETVQTASARASGAMAHAITISDSELKP